MKDSPRLRCLLGCVLVSFGTSILASAQTPDAPATDENVDAIGDARNPSPTTVTKAFSVPAGSKFLSFDASLLDSVNGTPGRDSFGFKIVDGAGNLLLTVVLKPADQSDDPENNPASWLVFYAIGGGPLQPTEMNIPERMLTTFTVILTPKGVTFRFGPAGESFVFTSPPAPLPQGADLSDRTLKVVFEWIFPEGSDPGANFFQFANFSKIPHFPGGVGNRGPNEPFVTDPGKGAVSPQ